MVVLGFASFALANVLAESLTEGIAPAAVGAVTMLFAAIVLWGLVWLLESPAPVPPSTDAWLKLVALGVVGSAIPTVLVFLLVQRAGAGFMSLFGYLLPILGIVVGWTAFSRAPESTLFVGMPITFAGVALVNWARQRGPASPATDPAVGNARGGTTK